MFNDWLTILSHGVLSILLFTIWIEIRVYKRHMRELSQSLSRLFQYIADIKERDE